MTAKGKKAAELDKRGRRVRQNPTAQRARINAFLAAIRETAQINRAVELAGIDRTTHYDWLKHVPGYHEEFQEAWRIGIESLEAEVVRRAKDGVRRPIYQGGKLVGHEQVFSDRLAELVLKGNLSDRYKERVQQDVTLHGDVADRLAAARKRIQSEPTQ